MKYFEDKKIRMLIVFLHWHVGGATTSLINFLQSLDYSKYSVDLQFYRYESQGEGIIPDEVNILPQAVTEEGLSLKNILRKAVHMPYVIAKFRSLYELNVRHRKLKSIQIMSEQGCRFSRRPEGHYDVAFAYELTWPFYYMMNFADADKKVIMIHNDYDAIGYDYSCDKKYFNSASKLLFVSSDCLEKFKEKHGEIKDKCVYMPNLISEKAVRALRDKNADMPFPPNSDIITLVSVSRIDFRTKALYRGVELFTRLREDKLDDKCRWLVIGKGHDLENLKSLIKENNLEDKIFCVGLKTNPIAYMKHCDLLFLPSLCEGSPMVVVEAQIAGLPPAVARYTSADEQIVNGEDGFIFENDMDSIYSGIKDLILSPDKIKKAKETLLSRHYDNSENIKIFDDIIDNLYK